MERGIGETFIFKGEKYMVCEHTAMNVSHCWNCAFRHVSCGALGLDECGRKYRADNKNVFFYKIFDDKQNENMNEKIDLTELLKGCPKGTKLWSSIYGNVELDRVCQDNQYPIRLTNKYGNEESVSSKGFYIEDYDGECILFPSKDQRDWSKFKVPVEKFDYSTLNPFDRVLVRDADRDIWRCNSFTCFDDDQMVCDERWQQGIPYNDDTKHLAGTTDMPDEKYVWWED